MATLITVCEPCNIALQLTEYIKGVDTTQLKNPLAQLQSWVQSAAQLHKECPRTNCDCLPNHEEIALNAWRSFYDKGKISAKKD